MLRRFLALALLAVLFGTGSVAPSVDTGSVAATAVADPTAAPMAAGDAIASTLDDGGDAASDLSVDLTALADGTRALPATGLPNAAPSQRERLAAAPPYLEGLRRPPRA